MRPISESGWEDDTRRLIDENAAATGLAVVADLDTLMAAQRQLAVLEQQKQLQAGQIEALGRTVDGLRTRLAEAARNVANLALLHDVKNAVAFYGKALAAEPDDVESWWLSGHALITLGDLPAARNPMAECLRLADVTADTRSEMAALNGLGDIHRATGDLMSGQAAFAVAQQLAERPLSADPADAEPQRDLSVSFE